MKKEVIISLFVLLFAVHSSGCSVIMAAKQPPYKDVNKVVKESTPREVLIAEFGTPRSSVTNKEGLKEDVFIFKQGYGRGNKAFRVLFHLAGDLFTLFLWELIATPTEMIANGKDITFRVIYDEKDNVKSYEFFN